MNQTFASQELARLLIILPNWVGDVVLATPALRAIRQHLPQSHITYLMRPYVADVLNHCPWVDQTLYWPDRSKKPWYLWRFARSLRSHHFSAVVLLANSFRTGVWAWWTGVPRRIGYDRDYRGLFLTDRIPVPRENGHYRMESMLDYYGRIAEFLGAASTDRRLQLFADSQTDLEIARWREQFQLTTDRPLVILNPGSSFGSSKLYPADRFAAVGDMLSRESHAQILITGGPGEAAIVQSVAQAMKEPAVSLLPPQLNLRRLKSWIAQSNLLITNDTGPRHFAIAFGVPVVTIFGPTHPQWTETHFQYERKVSVPVDCGPCQKPRCPLDHRCMTGIDPRMIVTYAQQLLQMKPDWTTCGIH